jgi:uncharacterized protein (UPF0332 family)
VTPETGYSLEKARLSLDHARTFLGLGLCEEAGRAAYLAAFHAAQAFIFERSGQVAKTHKGVHSRFAELTASEPGIDTELRRFLPRAYDLKTISDYGIGPDAVVPLEKAEAAIEIAERFINVVEGVIKNS